MSEQHVSAEIDRPVLLDVLGAAEAAFRIEFDDAHNKVQADIARIMATKKTFWTNRPYTYDEALNHLSEMWWSWSAAREKNEVRSRLDRVKNLTEIVKSSKLGHIRLTENDLSMLKAYL